MAIEIPNFDSVDNPAEGSVVIYSKNGEVYRKNSDGNEVSLEAGYSAWARVAADGTVLDSRNVASVTKSATGTYDITFQIQMNNANYAAIPGCNGSGLCSVCTSNHTVDGFRVETYDSNNQLIDMPFSVVTFGGM